MFLPSLLSVSSWSYGTHDGEVTDVITPTRRRCHHPVEYCYCRYHSTDFLLSRCCKVLSKKAGRKAATKGQKKKKKKKKGEEESESNTHSDDAGSDGGETGKGSRKKGKKGSDRDSDSGDRDDDDDDLDLKVVSGSKQALWYKVCILSAS